MKLKTLVTLGADDGLLERLRTLRAGLMHSHSGFNLLDVPIDPPSELERLANAVAFLLDGRRDLPLAVAEAARLSALARPVAIVVNSSTPSEPALRRARVAATFSSAISPAELIRFLQGAAPCRAPLTSYRPDAGPFTPLTDSVYVDRARRLLRVGGNEVALSAQKFDLLCYLIDRSGTAASASELVRIGLLRPSQAQRLKGIIQELRTCLGSARDVVRPVPGFGYRLELSG